MDKYFITTDYTADFPPELAEEDFRILPMSYVLDGKEYDGVNTPYLPIKEFYSKIAQGSVATTSRVSLAEAYLFFAEILKLGCDILHISFSSAMSGCLEAYTAAAERAERDFPGRRVRVIDSKCACAGEGLLCYYALRKRGEGASLEENAEYVTELRDHIGHAFTVDDLYCLHRGGRLSKGAAAVGQAIKLKPILMVDENGALTNIANVLGRKIAVRTLVDKMARDSEGVRNDIVFIAHGDCLDDAKLLASKVNERFGNIRTVITYTGPIIGSHCGKGMLALLYLANNKTDRRI